MQVMDKSLLTYYGSITPPLVLVKTNKVSLPYGMKSHVHLGDNILRPKTKITWMMTLPLPEG